MEKEEFFIVHKSYAQDGSDGPVFGHSEFSGLARDAAYAKYHELFAAAYSGSDPWVNIYIDRDDGVTVEGNIIDRRTEPQTETETETETIPSA